MKFLHYLLGDPSAPKSAGPLIIAHICNDMGIWHGQVANRILRKWPQAYTAYERWYRERLSNDFGLGAVQFVNVNRTHVSRMIRVANMVAQRGTIRVRGKARPIHYQTIAGCLSSLALRARRIGASVHMPRIGMDQAESSWSTLECIIQCTLCDREVPVYVYDLDMTYSPAFTHSPKQGARRRFEIADVRSFDHGKCPPIQARTHVD